jgi:hypothetical protein
MAILMEPPPLTPAQRLAVDRDAVELGAWIEQIKLLFRKADGADMKDVTYSLAEREHELSKLRALLAR